MKVDRTIGTRVSGASLPGRFALLASCLAILAAAGCQKEEEVGGPTPWGDVSTPARIEDLVAETGTSVGTVDLTWTAVGDDGFMGDALEYEVRYAASPIDEATWDAASLFDQTLVPAPPGTVEHLTLDGLTGGAVYYVGIRVRDAVQNESRVSNTPDAVAMADTADVTPPSAVADLAAFPGPALGSVTLTWTAPGDDGASGTASSYIVKFASSAIDAGTWSSATVYTQGWTPLAAGEAERRVLNGFTPGTTCFFALAASDEVPNTGAVSNSPSIDAQTVSITPSRVRIGRGKSITFSGAGGREPYAFSITSFPPMGVINSATGQFTASPTPSVVTIRVTDNDGNWAEAEVTVYDDTAAPSPYKVVCLDYPGLPDAITVQPGTIVNFQILNGTAPDSFDVINGSGGRPVFFDVAARKGAWQAGSIGADDGSVFDAIRVFDSDDPPYMAQLTVYVSSTGLAIQPPFSIVQAGASQPLTASPAGVGTVVWTIPVNQSGAIVNPTLGSSTSFTAGSTTNGLAGSIDTVQARDSFNPVPQVAKATVSVPGLSIFPKVEHINVAPFTVPVYALGGSGSYNWQLIQGPAFIVPGGSLCQVSVMGFGHVIVRVTDGTAGGLAEAEIFCAPYTNQQPSLVSPYLPTSNPGGNDMISLDVVVDDFDGNGVDDVAYPQSSNYTYSYIGDFQGNELGVALGGSSPGSFSGLTWYDMGTNKGLWGITSGDFNVDGNRDLAVACYSSHSVVVLFGDGTGAFPNSGNYPHMVIDLGLGVSPTAIKAYNFDRAQGDDLVVCDGGGGKLFVLLSKGGGAGSAPAGFDVAATLAGGSNLFGVALENFDNDTAGSASRSGNSPNGIGWVDIAVTDHYSDRVIIFPGTGPSSWNEAAAQSFTVYQGVGPEACYPAGITAAKLDSDPYPDIVTANNGIRYNYYGPYYRGITILRNVGIPGALAFSGPVEYGSMYAYREFFWDVLAHDFNNDGYDDIVATNRAVRHSYEYDSYIRGWYVMWRAYGDGSLRGYWYSDSYPWGCYYSFDYYYYPTGIDLIDFGGPTRIGCPVPDFVCSNGCRYPTYPYTRTLSVYWGR